MFNRNENHALDQVRSGLAADHEKTLNGIMVSFVNAQARYSKLCDILHVAQFNPPEKWVKMKHDNPLLYLHGIVRFLLKVERLVESHLKYLQLLGFDDGGQFLAYTQFHANQRLNVVLKMSKDKLLLGQILNDGNIYSLFFEVIKTDFFKPHKAKKNKASVFAGLMKEVFSLLNTKEREFNCLVSLVDIFRTLIHSRLHSIKQAPHAHELGMMFFKLIGWFTEAKYYLPFDISELEERYFQLLISRPVYRDDEDAQQAAETLLVLSDVADSSLTQSSKRVKLMAQPAVLFQLPKMLAPLPDSQDKMQLEF